jgi:ParB family chromosome partitioning protein
MAVPHKAIFLSAMNPRKDRGDLEGLKESILAHGIIEPLVVRHNGSDHTYELIVGERRLSALNELVSEGFFSEDVTVPVVLREMDDNSAKQMMIVENMMRKDLTELEQARAFRDYLAGKDGDELHDAVFYLSEKTGLSPRFIRRRVQILTLPDEILNMWNEGDLCYGHLEQLMRLAPDEAK